MELAKIAAITDLSGFGRCSLTVAIPILSAMGYSVCPAPTAVLSAHTGYPHPHRVPVEAELDAYLRHWETLGLTFDAIYTGYLGDERQADPIERMIRRAGVGTLCVVDPAMADHGRLYASCTPATVAAMKRLAATATVTTPNLTEACLLTGERYDELMALDEPRRIAAAGDLGRRLTETGCGAAVITGVPGDGWIHNVVVAAGEAPQTVTVEQVDRRFAGTGDVFSALMCGWLLRGLPLVAAVERAAAFVLRVARATAADGTASEQDGIAFEPFLGELGTP